MISSGGGIRVRDMHILTNLEGGGLLQALPDWRILYLRVNPH